LNPNTEEDMGEGASDSAKPRTCYFGSSTITVKNIKEMDERGYFPEGVGRAPGIETVPEPNDDEAVVYDLPACACLHILHWLIFFYIFRRSCIS
jgi:hypothetical protein